MLCQLYDVTVSHVGGHQLYYYDYKGGWGMLRIVFIRCLWSVFKMVILAENGKIMLCGHYKKTHILVSVTVFYVFWLFFVVWRVKERMQGHSQPSGSVSGFQTTADWPIVWYFVINWWCVLLSVVMMSSAANQMPWWLWLVWSDWLFS